MNVLAESGGGVNGADNFAREIVGMRSGEAHAANAGHSGDGTEEFGEIHTRGRRITIGIYGLAEELDFHEARLHEVTNFVENGPAGAAALRPARVRHDA